MKTANGLSKVSKMASNLEELKNIISDNNEFSPDDEFLFQTLEFSIRMFYEGRYWNLCRSDILNLFKVLQRNSVAMAFLEAYHEVLEDLSTLPAYFLVNPLGGDAKGKHPEVMRYEENLAKGFEEGLIEAIECFSKMLKLKDEDIEADLEIKQRTPLRLPQKRKNATGIKVKAIGAPEKKLGFKIVKATGTRAPKTESKLIIE